MKKILLFLLALSMALTACQSSAASKKLEIELSDFKITPGQLSAQAGAQVTVSITNNGTVKHQMSIFKLGTEAGAMFDDQDRQNVLWEIEVQPGETKSATLIVPEAAGIYQVVCAMPGHLQAGMFGSLDVVK